MADKIETRNVKRYNRVKWVVYISLFIGYSAYYFARKSYTFAMPSLLRELNLKKSQLGITTSGFAFCYGISKFAGGVLSDRVSARELFILGMLLSGVINIAIGFSGSVWILTVLWSMNGLVQGCGWPPCTKLLKEWFSPTQVGTLWSLLTAGCNLSTSLSPLLTAYLTTNYGWASAFFVPGIGVSLMSAVLYFSIYNSPAELNLTVPKEINTNNFNKKNNNSAVKKETFIALLLSPFLWVLCVNYMLTMFIKVGVADWGQLYLMQGKEKSQYDAGLAISMVEIGGLAGSLCSGYITDKMVEKYGISSKSSPRMTPLIIFVLLLFLCLHFLHSFVNPSTSSFLVCAIIFGIGFSLYGPINIYGVLAVENGPPGLSGTSHAIVGLSANAGAVMAGYPLAVISKQFGWEAVFVFLQITSVISLLLLTIFRNTNKQMVDMSKLE